MGIKTFKPTSKGVRFRTNSDYAEITASKPEKSLTVTIKSKGGRNNNGRITVRHQGAGNKRLYRIIDFKRNKDSIPAKVSTIEYDPNRSARIALIVYADGEILPYKYTMQVSPSGMAAASQAVPGEFDSRHLLQNKSRVRKAPYFYFGIR